MLVTACMGTWVVEQPSNSVLEFYPAFRFLLSSLVGVHESISTERHSVDSASHVILYIELASHQSLVLIWPVLWCSKTRDNKADMCCAVLYTCSLCFPETLVALGLVSQGCPGAVVHVPLRRTDLEALLRLLQLKSSEAS